MNKSAEYYEANGDRLIRENRTEEALRAYRHAQDDTMSGVPDFAAYGRIQNKICAALCKKNGMKYLITNKSHYEVIDNGEALEIRKVGHTEIFKDSGYLILSLGGIDSVRKKLISEEEYKKIKADRKANAEAREAEAEAKEEKLDLLLADTAATAKEILTATIAVLNSENGWFIADKVFGGENALTAALLNYGGAFTFTPFDNGEIVIKFDNGSRYSTSRRSHLQNTGRISEII